MFEHLKKKANHLLSMNHIRIENSVWFAGRLTTILLSIQMTNCVSFFSRQEIFLFQKRFHLGEQTNDIRVKLNSDHVETWISSLHWRNQKIIFFFTYSHCNWNCLTVAIFLGSIFCLENIEMFFKLRWHLLNRKNCDSDNDF